MSTVTAKKPSQVNTSDVQKAMENLSVKTPVTVLQEIMTKVGQAPVYEIIPNDTNPVSFTCNVSCINRNAVGTGKSKKDAKHDAAKNMIEKLYEKTINSTSVEDLNQSYNKDDNSVVMLQFMCKKYNLDEPEYIEGKKINSRCGTVCHYHCVVVHFCTEGTGETGYLAQQDSAKKMIEELNEFFNLPKSKSENKEKISKSQDITDFVTKEGNSRKRATNDFESNELSVNSEEPLLDKKLLALLKYVSGLAKNCSKNINNRDVNISKSELIVLRREFEQFLKLAKINFYESVTENSESETFLYVIQLNSDFELVEMSLGKTQQEAELRAVNKMITALQKKFSLKN